MKAHLDDAATEPDGLVRIPPTTDERSIGALLEGLDEPQRVVPARVPGSALDVKPRAQLETALLPDVDRRQRRKGAVIGLALGLSVTLIAGTVAIRTVFVTHDADAAGPAVMAAPLAPLAPPAVARPAGTWTTATAAAPIAPPPTAAVTDLPVAAPPPSPSASAAAPSTAKRPVHPTSSSSPGESRRGYGLTSDEP